MVQKQKPYHHGFCYQDHSGISYVEAGMILGDIDDVRRFLTPSKLPAFAGLDPSVFQSGNFNASRTKISKCGSSPLHYALDRCAGKLVRIIHKMLTDEVAFNLE